MKINFVKDAGHKNKGNNMESETSRILSEEHKNILKVIAIIKKECEAIKNGKQADKEFFSDAVDFIRNYADRFHHAKEEDILFKEFCNNESEMHCNPVNQMLFEHETGRNFVKGIESGIKENSKDKIVENALGYAQLLEEHIYKEDNILYPMADEGLSEKIKVEMLKKFKNIDKEKSKDKEKYIKLIEKLGKR